MKRFVFTIILILISFTSFAQLDLTGKRPKFTCGEYTFIADSEDSYCIFYAYGNKLRFGASFHTELGDTEERDFVYRFIRDNKTKIEQKYGVIIRDERKTDFWYSFYVDDKKLKEKVENMERKIEEENENRHNHKMENLKNKVEKH